MVTLHVTLKEACWRVLGKSLYILPSFYKSKISYFLKYKTCCIPINPTNLPVGIYPKEIIWKAHKAVCVNECLWVYTYSIMELLKKLKVEITLNVQEIIVSYMKIYVAIKSRIFLEFIGIKRYLQSVCALLCSAVSNFTTPRTVAHRLLCPWDFPGKDTRVGCHSLFQGIFQTQGLSLRFLHCRQILYHLSICDAHFQSTVM